jgi:hypothetical protein
MDRVIELLEEAVQIARRAGHPCEGWTLQREEIGYCAWLHEDSDLAGHVSLFRKVECFDDPLEAARHCLLLAAQLPSLAQDAEA